MFIILRYGAGIPTVYNPDCASINFWNHVRAKLRDGGFVCNSTDTLDLCDVTGNVKDVRHLSPMQPLAPLLLHKETYFVVAASSAQEDDLPFLPVLDTSKPVYSELKEQLVRRHKQNREEACPQRTVSSAACTFKAMKDAASKIKSKVSPQSPTQAKGSTSGGATAKSRLGRN